MAGMGFPANGRFLVQVIRVEPRLGRPLLYLGADNPQAAGNKARGQAGSKSIKRGCDPIL